MKIKILIIENDLKNPDEVFAHINNSKIKNLEVVGRTKTLKEALTLYSSKTPDIIFLDTHLQDSTGFDFINKIENPNQIIIMVTSHAEHALKAYEANVNAYLTKPISPSRFNEIIERTTELVKLQKKTSGKLIIKDSNKESHIIDANKIIKLKSIGKGITEIHTNNNAIISNKSIGKIQEKLDPTLFIRINWGIVINSTHILKIDFKNNIVFLKNDSEETMSFRRKKDLKDFICQ